MRKNTSGMIQKAKKNYIELLGRLMGGDGRKNPYLRIVDSNGFDGF